MTTIPQPAPNLAPARKGLFRFLLSELKPKGKLLTPFNLITIPIILATLVILVVRFAYGLGATTNLSQQYPWGLWIGFDVVTGVAFAGGAYVVTFLVYILGIEKYRPIVRVTVLNGFLAYVFYAGALLVDLGRPWNVINPIIGNSFGVSSVLFLVAWHFMLYMLATLIEFAPAVAEWLGLRRLRRILGMATLGAVIFGITLSTLHQSGLGALFLMAKTKIHPLWYSEFIPVLFFVSSIFAGLSMVIFEGSITHKVFHEKVDPADRGSHDGILVGLARICAGGMFVYLFLLILAFLHGQNWSHLGGGMGLWYGVEVVGFVILPLLLFLRGASTRSLGTIRLAALLAMLGIVVNRLNVTVIAYEWNAAVRYIPSWMEIVVTLGVVAVEIWVFRWVINRMPVLGGSPEWAKSKGGGAEEE